MVFTYPEPLLVLKYEGDPMLVLLVLAAPPPPAPNGIDWLDLSDPNTRA